MPGPKYRTLLIALPFAACAAVTPLQAQEPDERLADDQTIVASVNVPAPDLSCGDAALQARVTFKALKLPFEVKRVSVFVDGQGLPESSVEEAWPSIAVTRGLHPGRNLVELIVYGPDNQSMDRKQSVLIGVAPGPEDIAPAQIDCVGGVATVDAAPVEEAPEPVDEEPPPEAVAEDEDEPVYVPEYQYYPAPVFLGPVFSVGYFAPPPVYYAPAPPLFVYNRWRWHDHDHFSRGGDHGRQGWDRDHDHNRDQDRWRDHQRDSGNSSNSRQDWRNDRGRAPGDGGGHHDGAQGEGGARGSFGRPLQHGTFSTYTPPPVHDLRNSGDGREFNRPALQNGLGDARLARPQFNQPGPSFNHEFNRGPQNFAARGQQGSSPRPPPPPSRELSPPRQMPLPSQRFSGPSPQAHGEGGGRGGRGGGHERTR